VRPYICFTAVSEDGFIVGIDLTGSLWMSPIRAKRGSCRCCWMYKKQRTVFRE